MNIVTTAKIEPMDECAGRFPQRPAPFFLPELNAAGIDSQHIPSKLERMAFGRTLSSTARAKIDVRRQRQRGGRLFGHRGLSK
jgi:hypothetical protein